MIGASRLSFGSEFPGSFFGNSTMKKEFLGVSDFSTAIAEGRAAVSELIGSVSLSASAAEWCNACFAKAPEEFFYMPTSSTSKYHGGPQSAANCVGGNIVHTKQVLEMAPKVLNRYESALGVFYEELSMALKVACILHDIAKYDAGGLYVSKYHGENGAELLKGVETSFDFAGLVTEAVQNHMYCWRFQTVYDYVVNFGAGSLNSLFLNFMLSECDYYSIR